jgi:uncharacterized membrane protein
MKSRVASIFNTHAQALAAIDELRMLGVPNSHISVVTRHTEHATFAEQATTADVSDAAGKGLAAGVGAGVVFGLASIVIPGVGPFIAAGALASLLGVTGAAVATGAAVGAGAGAIAGALTQVGYNERDAKLYADRIEQGHVFLVVDADDSVKMTHDAIESLFQRHGGHSFAESA